MLIRPPEAKLFLASLSTTKQYCTVQYSTAWYGGLSQVSAFSSIVLYLFVQHFVWSSVCYVKYDVFISETMAAFRPP